MSAPAIAVGKPTLRIRDTSYPILLPKLSDPRLHLAAVIISLQVLGQVAFDFRLSIAQILIAILTCAVLEVGIAMRRDHVLMWPASAMLTGNGVAFILRVPGTEHGDWWSLNGWWIFAGTAAVSLLSKYLIQMGGRHVFNPSNFGLVLCFLLLGPERADPLEFWWGPMTPLLALALAIIVAGGLAILLRLHILSIAIGFWVTFAAALAVLAAVGHEMTARWHVGPVTDWEFWRILVFSPEILVFLFFMITDPRTIPRGPAGRRVYAVSIGLLAVLLIAPQTTEFASKVAVLAALFIVCAARAVLELSASRGWLAVRRPSRLPLALGSATGAVAFVGLLVLAGLPARPSAAAATGPVANGQVAVSVRQTPGVAAVDSATAERIAHDVVAGLEAESEALRRRDPARAATGADGEQLAAIWSEIRAARGRPVVVPRYRVESVAVTLEPASGQSPPTVVARVVGTVERVTYEGSPVGGHGDRERPCGSRRTYELAPDGGRYLIVRVRGAASTPAAAPVLSTEAFGGVQLHDVAAEVGLDFRHAAFRFGMSDDTPAMMGGGLCWLDADEDGWLDLFVVNSYSNDEIVRWQERGGLPRSALFRNERGRFVDASRGSGADLPIRGSGCVAADFDGDGHTDLYVTAGGYNFATDGYDALLWGHGDGTFTEGAAAAGLGAPGWHSGAAVGDVNGDGRPDLFVAGYTDVNAPIPGSPAGFPTNHRGVRDLLYLNDGPDANGRSRFREVGAEAGLERGRLEHGLGAVFTDVNGDGRLDLYVANDEDPNRLYLNVRADGGLGFRLEERGSAEGVDDANAGMGIAAADWSGDGRDDLFVTNSRNQLHAAYRSAAGGFDDARAAIRACARHELHRLGRLVGRSRPRRQPRSRARERRHPAPPPRPRRAADPGAREPRRRGGARRVRRRRRGDRSRRQPPPQRARTRRCRLRQRRRSRRGGQLRRRTADAAPEHRRHRSLARGRATRFLPGTRVTAVLPDGRRLVREVHAGSSYLSSEDPRRASRARWRGTGDPARRPLARRP